MLQTKQKLLLGLAILLFIVGAAFVHSRLALQSFEQALAPAEHNKARIIGDRLSRLVLKMLDYGVPVTRLKGMDEVFQETQKKHPDISYIALSRGQKLLYLSWQDAHRPLFFSISEPELNATTASLFSKTIQFPAQLKPDLGKLKVLRQIVKNPQIKGQKIILTIGLDKEYIARQQREILLDSLTVLLVTLLMGMELLVFLYVFMIARPFNTLKRAMEGMSQGDFSQVYEFDSQDEIGRSGRLLNQIILRLNQRFYQHSSTVSDRRLPIENQGGKIRFGKPKKLNMLLDEALIYVRPPLFLVVFAESMSLSFFPDYVSRLYANMNHFPVSKELMISLPISAFMLVWALSLPKAGLWSERIGRKRAFLLGGLVTSVGLVLTALSKDIMQLLVFRSITAVGYGVVFITAQGYVTDLTSPKNRTRGMAVFLSSFFSGSLSGAAIGGILADQLGYSQTFMLSALLSAGSALFASRFFVSHRPDKKPESSRSVTASAFNMADIRKLFTNRYFLTVTLFSSIPAKAALTGIIYFAGPVYLASLGASKSDTGRVLMLYGLLIILISPSSAWVVDRIKKPREFILLGGCLSCVALLIIAWTGNLLGVSLGIAGLGLAHAFSVSPQAAVISARVPSETGLSTGKIIGLYRLTERIGNISGPLLAALLISYLGYHQAFIVFGVMIATGAILFYALSVKEAG